MQVILIKLCVPVSIGALYKVINDKNVLRFNLREFWGHAPDPPSVNMLYMSVFTHYESVHIPDSPTYINNDNSGCAPFSKV